VTQQSHSSLIHYDQISLTNSYVTVLPNDGDILAWYLGVVSVQGHSARLLHVSGGSGSPNGHSQATVTGMLVNFTYVYAKEKKQWKFTLTRWRESFLQKVFSLEHIDQGLL
jgi:hypothetical protein